MDDSNMVILYKVKKELYRLIQKKELLLKNIKNKYFKDLLNEEPYYIVNIDNYAPFSYFNWDPWSDTWKGYYLANYENCQQKLDNLKKGMDEESSELAQLIYNRNFFITPRNCDNKYYLFDRKQVFTKEELEEQERVKKLNFKSKYDFVNNPYTMATIIYENGLGFIKDKITEYIKNKDFIDGGAFVGDSATIFYNYSPNKIYSFEPMDETFQSLEKNIKQYNLGHKVIPVKLGFSNKKETITLYGEGAGSSKFNYTNEIKTQTIETITIDEFVEQNSLNLGLIKLDIEGSELEAIQGAINSIKKFKPVLLISVYHHPKDFFEIKPLIENLGLGYKFILKKLEPTCLGTETMLIGYPENEQ